jgi:hypothetical protein
MTERGKFRIIIQTLSGIKKFDKLVFRDFDIFNPGLSVALITLDMFKAEQVTIKGKGSLHVPYIESPMGNIQNRNRHNLPPSHITL